MRKLLIVALFVTAALSFLAASVAAQEEVTRELCNPADPLNSCPPIDPDCCVDDTLEIVFDSAESTNSIFTYDEFVAGMEIQTWQIGNIVSEGIEGWALSVAHDGDALDLIDVTYAGGPGEQAVTISAEMLFMGPKTPGFKGERFDIPAGQIDVLEFLRFLADGTGLPVIRDWSLAHPRVSG